MNQKMKPSMAIGVHHTRLDYISDLPDELLCTIISLLAVDEAVRTSILAKRWTKLWRYTTRLDFDAKFMIKPLSRLLNARNTNDDKRAVKDLHGDHILNWKSRCGLYIYLVLLRHNGDLTSCRFLHFPESFRWGEVEGWVKLLVQRKRGFQHLNLECEDLSRGGRNNFRSGTDGELELTKPSFSPKIFSCLCTLELTNYTLESSAPFEGCQNLRTLKLKKVNGSDKTLHGILANCKFLENLHLIACVGFKLIKIKSAYLKCLELRGMCVNCEIDAANLSSCFAHEQARVIVSSSQ